MSFSNEVRKEIILNVKKDYDNRDYFVYGVLLFSKNLLNDNIILTTENKDIARILQGFFTKKLKVNFKMLKRNEDYILTFLKKEDLEKSLLYFENKKMYINNTINESILLNHKNYKAFLSGAFVSAGSINNPLKDYHLEFIIGDNNLAKDLKEVLSGLSLSAKTTERKSSGTSTYLRDSTGIEEFLTYIGAHKSALKVMKVKIYKDVRNKVNRTTNFETANIERTANAYAEQIRDIEYIINNNGIDALDEDLKKTIDIRTAHPELSLKDLGEKFTPPLSRSAVNYRIQKIRKYAEKLRIKKEE